jgi:hypothetical protein
MPSACHNACEVCGIRERVGCPLGDGCVPGTDPKAPEKLAKFTAAMGHPCFVLECAINKKVDYCTRCDEFPCDIHYNKQQIYSHQLLDMLKGMLVKK